MQLAEREVASRAIVTAMAVPREPEILERILAFRSPEVPMRIAQKVGISLEEAERLFNEILKYLYVCRQARKARIPVAPSLVLDDGWHNFVLFTKEYARFCEGYVGEFIHHIPDMGKPDPKRYAVSRQMAESLLDYLDPTIWPESGMANCCQSIPSCSECQAPCGNDGNE